MNNCSRVKLLAALLSLMLWGGYVTDAQAADNVNKSLPAEQTKKVTGTVSDADGPIIGATVRVKGSTVGAVTDLDGKFSIDVPAGATLEISYVGYDTKVVKVGNQSVIDVVLSQDAEALEEVVVVGYGTMKKSDLAGASASMDEKAIKGANITNIDQSFQGRVTGVTAVQTSGAPGSSSSIRVRGQATINAGAEPLYVIDGVIAQGSGNQSGASLGLGDALGNGSVSTVSPLATINPADIVSMEILKDASATAIYGAQGANGVVLITTKRGKAGEAKFTYDGSVSVHRQMKRLELLNLRDFAEFYNDMATQGGHIAIQVFLVRVRTGRMQCSAQHGSTSIRSVLRVVQRQLSTTSLVVSWIRKVPLSVQTSTVTLSVPTSMHS